MSLKHDKEDLKFYETLDHNSVTKEPMAENCGENSKYVFIDPVHAFLCVETCGDEHDNWILESMSYSRLEDQHSNDFCATNGYKIFAFSGIKEVIDGGDQKLHLDYYY